MIITYRGRHSGGDEPMASPQERLSEHDYSIKNEVAVAGI